MSRILITGETSRCANAQTSPFSPRRRLQVLSNIAQDSSARLPYALRSLYVGVGLLQLKGVSLPPSCLNSYPFSSDVSVLGVALGAWLAALAAVYLRRSLPYRAWRPVALVGISLAVYLHPAASASALRLLDCRTVQLSATAVAALEVSTGGSAATATTDDVSASVALRTVSVLSSNSLIQCFGTLHAPAGWLAAASLLVYVAAMPVCTLTWLWFDARLALALRACSRAEPSKHLPQPEPLLYPFLNGSDYRVESWFWRHIDIAVVFGLSATTALLPTASSLTEVAVKLGVVLTLLCALAVLLVVLPNPYRRRWKRSIRLSLIALSAACALIDAAARALDLGYGSSTLEASVTPSAYCIVILTGLTLAAVVVGIWYEFLSEALRRRDSMESSGAPSAISAVSSPSASALDDHRQGLHEADQHTSNSPRHADDLLGRLMAAGSFPFPSPAVAAFTEAVAATSSRLHQTHVTQSNIPVPVQPSREATRRRQSVDRFPSAIATPPREKGSAKPLALPDVESGPRHEGAAAQRTHGEPQIPRAAASSSQHRRWTAPSQHAAAVAATLIVSPAAPSVSPGAAGWNGFLHEPFESESRGSGFAVHGFAPGLPSILRSTSVSGIFPDGHSASPQRTSTLQAPQRPPHRPRGEERPAQSSDLPPAAAHRIDRRNSSGSIGSPPFDISPGVESHPQWHTRQNLVAVSDEQSLPGRAVDERTTPAFSVAAMPMPYFMSGVSLSSQRLPRPGLPSVASFAGSSGQGGYQPPSIVVHGRRASFAGVSQRSGEGGVGAAGGSTGVAMSRRRSFLLASALSAAYAEHSPDPSGREREPSREVLRRSPSMAVHDAFSTSRHEVRSAAMVRSSAVPLPRGRWQVAVRSER